MKKHIILILLLSLFAETKASHIVGGNVEYTCIGPRQWKITLKIFRDCTGVPLCGSTNCPQFMKARPSIQYNPNGCQATPNLIPFTANFVKVEDANLIEQSIHGYRAKNGCNNLATATPGPLFPSIEVYTFEGILNLNIPTLNSSNCAYWDVYWELCCRNSGIMNLSGSSGQSYRFGCTINIFHQSTLSAGLKNNSPKVNQDMLLVAYNRAECNFNLAAIDPDGDSLRYFFKNSLQESGIPAVYQPPYGINYPFNLDSSGSPHNQYPLNNGKPYVIIDSNTGNYSFRPFNNTFTYMYGSFCIGIEQWAKNTQGQPILVGVTSADQQVYAVATLQTNTPPALLSSSSHASTGFKTQYSIGTGDSLIIAIRAIDSNYNTTTQQYDSTRILLFYKSDSTAIITRDSLKPREDNLVFRYKAGVNKMGTSQSFTFSAVDNQFPTMFVSKQFLVHIRNGYSRAQINKTLTDNCNQRFSVSYTNDSNIQSVGWAISNTPNTFTLMPGGYSSYGNLRTLNNLTFPDTGRYLIRLSAYRFGIPDVPVYYYDTITVQNYPLRARKQDTLVCEKTTVKLAAPQGSYNWYVAGQNTSISNNDTLNYFVTNNTTLVYVGNVTVSPYIGCSLRDTVLLSTKPLPVFGLTDSLLLCNGSASATVIKQSSLAVSYQWNDLVTDSSRIFTQPGLYSVTLTQANGCSAKDSLAILPGGVNTLLATTADTAICLNSKIKLRVSGADSYQWVSIKNSTITQLTGRVALDSLEESINTTTTYVITGFFNQGNSALAHLACTNADTIVITAKSIPYLNVLQGINICKSDSLISLPSRTVSPTNQTGGLGFWSLAISPQALHTNGNQTIIQTSQLAGQPADTFYSTMETSPGAGARKTYWAKYQYIAPASAGSCQAIDSIPIHILANPKVYGGSDATFCSSRTSPFLLINHNTSPTDATGKKGIWRIVKGGGLQSITSGNGNISYRFLPSQPTVLREPDSNLLSYQYTVTYVNPAGTTPSTLSCSNTDTINVSVLHRTIDAGTDKQFCFTNNSIDIGTAQNVAHGQMPFVYANTFNPVTSFNPSLALVLPQVNKFYLLDTANGCLFKDSFVYTVIPPPALNAGSDKFFCAADTLINLRQAQQLNNAAQLLLDATTGNPVLLFNPSTALVLPQVNKFYVVDTTNGCLFKDSFIYAVTPRPVLNAGSDKSFCAIDTIINIRQTQMVSNTAQILIDASSGQPVQQFNPSMAPLLPQVNKYYVVDTTAGCYSRDSFIYRVNPLPIVYAGIDKTVCQSEGIVLLLSIQNPVPTGGVFYNENGLEIVAFNTDSAKTKPAINTMFYKYTQPLTGCTNQDTFIYEVVPKPLLQYIIGDSLPKKNSTKTYTTNANPFHSLLWQVTGGTIQNANQNTVTVLWTDTGAASITVNSAGTVCADTSFSKTITVQPNTGLNEAESIQQLQLFPNPANDLVNIQFFTNEPSHVSLYNTALQVVYQSNTAKGQVDMAIPINHLSSGVYLIRIGNGQHNLTRKLVITR